MSRFPQVQSLFHMVNSLVFTKTDTYKFKRAKIHSSWAALYPEILRDRTETGGPTPSQNMEILTPFTALFTELRLHLFQYLCFDIEATFSTHH